jgi:hypothetical protein
MGQSFVVFSLKTVQKYKNYFFSAFFACNFSHDPENFIYVPHYLTVSLVG